MDAMHVILTLLLLISLGANAFQWHKWHSYRSKPAGGHSHTGMMPKVTRDQIDWDRRKKDG